MKSNFVDVQIDKTHHQQLVTKLCDLLDVAKSGYQAWSYHSRKGDCWDNPPMESFFGALQNERLHHYRFDTREQARRVVSEYIEVFYNRIRRHAKIGNNSPAEYANSFYAKTL